VLAHPRRHMEKRFDFADAFWFRVPLKVVVLSVAVFAFLSLYPALTSGSARDHERALFGLTVLGGFMAAATVFTVAINDSHVAIGRDHVQVRFEAFFSARIPLADIVGVRTVDPRPRWRYRFGLATNFSDRISCSHGGSFVEIELARPQMTRLWPRVLPVTRFWIAVREHDEFLAMLREIASISGDRALLAAA
jgi:hypothetical protein